MRAPRARRGARGAAPSKEDEATPSRRAPRRETSPGRPLSGGLPRSTATRRTVVARAADGLLLDSAGVGDPVAFVDKKGERHGPLADRASPQTHSPSRSPSGSAEDQCTCRSGLRRPASAPGTRFGHHRRQDGGATARCRRCLPGRPLAASTYLRARSKITSHSWPPIHPVWRRYSSVEYCRYAPSSRLASRASRHPRMRTYS